MAIVKNDLALAIHHTGLSEEKLFKFTEESFYAILETGDELNEDTLNRAIQRVEKKLERPSFQKLTGLGTSSNSSAPDTPEPS